MKKLNKIFTSKFYYLIPSLFVHPRNLLVDTSNNEAVGGAAGAIFFIIFFLFWLMIMSFFVLGFILWVLMLIDCLKRDFPQENDKIMWILILALTNWLGALIYYFIIKKPDKNKKKKENKKEKSSKK